MTQFKYSAFISYAHSDEPIARRIHRALETYPVPKTIGHAKSLKPIFRDVTELSAHHSLSEKIHGAVLSSRCLIVLCSPAAKTSHWVNEEIKLFRSLYGESSILCVIVAGTPQTAFPDALIDDGQEPLAADMTTRQGFRFGIAQLAAAMLRVDLDQLLQREVRRRKRRTRFIMGASLAFASAMGATAWLAADARDKAEISRAEAEKMVEFLITDLKTELAPVGRLSILDDVGQRVSAYYEAIPLSDMDDDRLGRQARSRHLLGEVAIKQGLTDRALLELTASYEATQELLRRNPNNRDAIFAHAQSEYWLGRVYIVQKQYEAALPYREAYNHLSETLYRLEPNNREWAFEYGWAQNNLGLLKQRMNDLEASEAHYQRALNVFQSELMKRPGDQGVQAEIVAIRKNLARTQYRNNKVQLAKVNYGKQISALQTLIRDNPQDTGLKVSLLMANIRLQEIVISEDGDCDMQSLTEIVVEMENLLALDRSNYEWAHRYTNFLHFFLEYCGADFESNWTYNKIIRLMELTVDVQYNDAETADKVKWLDRYKDSLLMRPSQIALTAD